MIYIENLNGINFFKFLIYNFKNRTIEIKRGITIYYFHKSYIGFFLFVFFFKIFKIKIIELDFKFFDIKIDDKFTAEIINYKISNDIIDKIFIDTNNRYFFLKNIKNIYKYNYIRKSIAYSESGLKNVDTICRKIFLINVIKWHIKKNNINSASFILDECKWFKYYQDYALNHSISLSNFKNYFPFTFFLTISKKNIKGFFRIFRKYLSLQKSINLLNNDAKICAEFNGTLNLDEKIKQSDLMYIHSEILENKKILVTPAIGRSFDNNQINLLKKMKMNYSLKTPLNHFYDEPIKSSSIEKHFINYCLQKYEKVKNSYVKYFKKTNSKIYVTHIKYLSDHIPINAAIREVGGISAMWQFSYDDSKCYELAITSDIYFSFAKHSTLLEKKNKSKISYNVITGYPGGYRFDACKEESLKIRKKITEKGAKKIISFFDESYFLDERWARGPSVICEEIEFFLNKLISDNNIGFIYKPKSPNTIFRMLKPIENLIQKALSTGRLEIIIPKDNKRAFSPAIASLASDIAISNTAFGGTAALESALTKTPTIILDRENWHFSRLYNLNKNGNVIFSSFEDIWDAINHFNDDKKIGNWDSYIKELDPFMDNKGHIRIGYYLNELLKGFRESTDQDLIMADVAEKYTKKWGIDKIDSIN